MTICGAVFNLLMYFLGFQTDKMATGQYLNWLGLIISIVILWLGIKAVREETPDKSLTYGQGVGAGTLISLYSGLMSAVYSYIHFKFINPAFFDYQAEMLRAQWAAKGMSDAQIEQAEAMTRKFSGPIASAIFTPIIVVIIGVLISLVLAAILKRAAAKDGGAPAAA